MAFPGTNISHIRWIMKSSRKIIAFAGGGSGGHVFPAFGVIDALEPAVRREYRMVWIGSRRGVERDIVARRGLEYRAISTGKLRRYLSLKNILDAFRFVFGIAESLVLLARLKPALLFSKGGFVSVPPVIAAGLLGIPVIAHESDYDPGLATRINLRYTRILCIPFEESRQFYAGSAARIEVTGNPVRQDILAGDARAGRKLAGFHRGAAAGLPLLLVQGGSLGARQINEMVAAEINVLLGSMCIIHQTGDENWNLDDVINPQLAGRYFHRPFFADEYPDVLAAAELVLSRAGAGSVWELGITGKPAVFVPLTAGARGDQLRNAEFASRNGAALVHRGGDPSGAGSAAALLLPLAAEPAERRRMGAAWKSIIHNAGASRIAALVAQALGFGGEDDK
jgi:UDP-N-acetylglucosamine--N-acetylmuramyl-(pentapeptide) pyrophosphoryl-undecaprenol N-acetylglucosamine transferase